jgi:hypothetical protein
VDRCVPFFHDCKVFVNIFASMESVMSMMVNANVLQAGPG